MALEFADLEKLPDTVEVDLGDGKKITLGEIRDAAKDHVNKRIADLTPREQKLVTREAALAEAEQRVRDTMALLASTPPVNNNTTVNNNPNAPAPPLGYTQQQWDAILADPYMRPLVTTMAALAEQTDVLKKTLESTQTTLKEKEDAARQLQETQWINYQLDQLSTSDGKYKDPTERQALLQFAQDTLKRRDLTVLHKARNYDSDIKKASEEAYNKGLQEGKGSTPVPSVVHGTRVVPTPAPPEKLPATFAEFADSAANDASLIQEIREAASQPAPHQ